MILDKSMDTTRLSIPDLMALYESILEGMQEYIARNDQCASFVEDVDPWDAGALYQALARAGVFKDPLSFNRVSLTVERTLWQGSLPPDIEAALAEVETMLTKLGTVPSTQSIGE